MFRIVVRKEEFHQQAFSIGYFVRRKRYRLAILQDLLGSGGGIHTEAAFPSHDHLYCVWCGATENLLDSWSAEKDIWIYGYMDYGYLDGK